MPSVGAPWRALMKESDGFIRINRVAASREWSASSTIQSGRELAQHDRELAGQLAERFNGQGENRCAVRHSRREVLAFDWYRTRFRTESINGTCEEGMVNGLTRRQLLRWSTLSAASIVLAACASPAAPSPTSAPTSAPTTAPTMAPTTAPAVEKTVAPTAAPTGAATVVSAQPSPTVAQPVTLTFMRAESECPKHSLARETPLVWQWWEEATGIHIAFELIPEQDYENVFQLKAAAGQIKADLIQMEGPGDGSYIAQYARDGLTLPLNDLIDQHAPNLKALVTQHPEYREALTLTDGKLYGIGNANISKYLFASFLIRKDWLDKLALAMPGTREDYLNIAKAFATRDPNGNGKPDEVGMLSADRLNGLLEHFGHSFDLSFGGGGWRVREGKVVNDFVNPKVKDLLDFMHKALQERALPPDYNDPTLDFQHVIARIYNGQLGLWVGMFGSVVGLLNWPQGQMRKNDPKAQWIMGPPPETDDGQKILYREPVATRGRVYGITRQCKDPVAAIRWYDFTFASQEGRDIYSYGKEGVTYKRNTDGTVQMLVKINSQDEVDSGPLAGKWWGGCVTIPIILDERQGLQQWKTWQIPQWARDSVEQNVRYARPAFQTPILPPEQAKEAKKLVTDYTTYKDESWAKFVAGDTPLTAANFEKYVKTLEEMGLGKVQKMYQDAYAASTRAQ